MADDDPLPRCLWYPRLWDFIVELQTKRPEFVFKVAGAMSRSELSMRLEAIGEELELIDEAPWSKIQQLLDELIGLVDQADGKESAAEDFRERIEKEQGLPGALVNCASLGGDVWIRFFNESFEPPNDGRLVYDWEEAKALLSRDRADCDLAVAFKRDRQRLVQEGPESKKVKGDPHGNL